MREKLNSWIPFSERKKIAERAIEWVIERGGNPDNAIDIVTALDAIGHLRRKPEPESARLSDKGGTS